MAQGRNLLADTQPKGRNLLADEIPTPSNIEEEQPDLSFDPFKIPETAAYSAVAGAFTPEILKGASRVAGVLPQTRAMAPMLDVMGEAAKGRRLSSAAAGGLLGGTGETSAQSVKALGGGPVLQEAARFGTEVFLPAGVAIARRNIPFTKDFIERGYKDAMESFAQSLRGGASAQARQSQEQVIAALEREAAFLRAQGKAQADQIVSAAEREAAMLAPTNAQQAAQIRQAARDRASATCIGRGGPGCWPAKNSTRHIEDGSGKAELGRRSALANNSSGPSRARR